MVEKDPPIMLNALKERLLNDFEVRVSVQGIGFANPQLHGRMFVYCEEGTLSDGKQPAKQVAKIRVHSANKYAHVAKQDYRVDG